MKMKKHANILYSLVALLLIVQIAAFFYLIVHVEKLDGKVNEVRGNLSSEFNRTLTRYDVQNQQNFKEISRTIASQQTSLEEQITLLKSEQGDFSSVIEKSVKGVVSVGTDRSLGSGFFVSSNYIVTNQHVINGANEIAVLTYDKKIYPAKLVGEDSFRDLALLKIDGSSYFLELSNSDDLSVGNKVIAIGNPLGLAFTVTEGIVSAVDREGPNNLREYIQTDVSLNPGNSGGPLINTKGEVVGVNNFKIGEAENLGFALESNSVKDVINKIANQTIIE